jgi:hypothetical protein
MSWLFPLYLAGAAAVIAPILLHLRRQPPQDRLAFSSLMFLEESKRQPTRRRRLENWLLLLVRCLILILLAIMFARPFSRSTEAAATVEGESVVVLLDASASMQRADLWPRAVAVVRSLVAASGAEDRVAVAVFDSEVDWLWAADEPLPEARWAAVTAALDQRQPGWGGTDLGQAMVAGLEIFGRWDGGYGGARRLVVVSDFQEGANLSALQKVAWPAGVTMERKVIALEEADAGNLTLELISGRGDEETELQTGASARADAVRRVRVSRTRETQQTDFELGWENDAGGVKVQGYLPPGGRRVVKMPPRGLGETGPSSLLLSGDSHAFDNRVHVAPEQPREVKVWIAAAALNGLDEAASPGYYLKRVLQPTPALRPVLEALTRADWAKVNGTGVVVNAGGGGRMDEEEITAWQKVLSRGGLGIYVVDGPAAESELKALTGGMTWTVKKAERQNQESYAMMGELDAKDELLTPFADARLRDFTKVRFWNHRVVTVAEDEGVKVLGKFDNGDPALIAVRRGQGTLLILTSGWHPADSQLALSTKFVPLWFGWLAAVGYAYEEAAALVPGQALPWLLKADGEVTDPKGETTVLKAGERFIPKQPGVYRVSQSGVDAESRWFAVQLSAEEGRVAVLPEERLKELGVSLAEVDGAMAGTEAVSEELRQRLDGLDTEAKQRLWLWFLLGVLGLVVAESLLSARRIRERVNA